MRERMERKERRKEGKKGTTRKNMQRVGRSENTQRRTDMKNH